MISVSNLTKSYGGIYALKNLNLEISPGEFVVLFGPNGAGKSTLLKILSTVLKPTEGYIAISDIASDNLTDARSKIGFVSHESYLYENLTAYENLVFFGRLYGLRKPAERAVFLLDKMHISNRAHDLVKNYSQGMKQRIALCRAVIHDPCILYLDEPFNSLDLPGINIIINLLKELKSDHKTILMSTHNYEQSIDLADRTLVLVDGELKFNSMSVISKEELNEIYSR